MEDIKGAAIFIGSIVGGTCAVVAIALAIVFAGSLIASALS